jgi:hypothetical protein
MKKIKFNEHQLTLPLGERGISLSYEGRERAFWFLVGVSVLSLFIYFYAINAMARNTALRSHLEAHLADANSRLGTLEFAYIDLENSVTAEVASAYGFKEVRKPLYVTRNAAPTLTLNSASR